MIFALSGQQLFFWWRWCDPYHDDMFGHMCANVKTPDYVVRLFHPHLAETTTHEAHLAAHFHRVMRVSQFKAILHINNQRRAQQPVT